MEAHKPPTGHDFRKALNDELTANLYPLPFSTLAPSVYHIYLHPEDFETIERIVPRIVSELATALTSDVERLNGETARRRGPLGKLLHADGDLPIEVPASGWEINIRADEDDELARGTFGIVSTLAVPAASEYVGSPTVRTVKTVFAGGQRTSAVVEPTPAECRPGPLEPATPSSVQHPTAIAGSTGPGLQAAAAPAVAAAPPTIRREAGPRATLSYQDDGGPHVFPMRKDLIKIGRGGSDAWVDVQVVANAKVSREHCWIQSDGSGRFVIRDVSTWGTSLNGEPIPAPVRSAEGLVVEAGAGKPLPPDARIQLADAIVIHFRAEQQP